MCSGCTYFACVRHLFELFGFAFEQIHDLHCFKIPTGLEHVTLCDSKTCQSAQWKMPGCLPRCYVTIFQTDPLTRESTHKRQAEDANALIIRVRQWEEGEEEAEGKEMAAEVSERGQELAWLEQQWHCRIFLENIIGGFLSQCNILHAMCRQVLMDAVSFQLLEINSGVISGRNM